MVNQNINEYFLKSVFSTASDAIIIIDSSGIIILNNDVAEKLFGYTKDELIGQNVKIITPEPHKSQHDNYIKSNIETGVNKVIGIGREVEGARKDGGLFPIRLALSRFVFEEKIYFTGVIHDLSREKETEQKLTLLNKNLENLVDSRTSQLMESVTQLSQSNKNLESEINERIQVEKKLKLREKELIDSIEKERNLNLLKSRFVSIASHEFRTPLANILSSINLIEHYNSKNESSKSELHLSKIKNNIHYLTGILNEFLTITQIEHGNFSLNMVHVSIDDVLREIVEEFVHIKKPAQKLSFQSHLLCDPTLWTDINCIKHIVGNLVGNSIKYSGEASIINVDLSVEEKLYRIIVEDNGIGIPKEEQKFIFDIFYRGSNVLNIQGTGLGLNVVKKYLDHLNGSIQLVSTENLGTKILITIPKYEK